MGSPLVQFASRRAACSQQVRLVAARQMALSSAYCASHSSSGPLLLPRGLPLNSDRHASIKPLRPCSAFCLHGSQTSGGNGAGDLDAAIPRSANLPLPRSSSGPTWGTSAVAPLLRTPCQAPLQCWSTGRHQVAPQAGIGSRRSRVRDSLGVEAHRGIPLLRHASRRGDVLSTWHRWQKGTWISPSRHAPPRAGLRVGDAGCG
jgi:hypothetical protein